MSDELNPDQEVKDFRQLDLPTDFGEKVQKTYELIQTIKLLEDELKQRKDDIRANMGNVVSVQCGKVRAILTKGQTTRKLDVDKLHKLGVPLSTIEASYVTTVGQPSLRIMSKVE